ncbi:unnamed protein product [Ilex paraguariensis]|uniref:BHLH domain-containing protein n=1 Tax=Ilex paraguariensis TaxID=185542 RepID=A0ABC8RF76_9AQUA
MATGQLNQDGVSENLRRQLALGVRSIQWSYAIFWSISSTQPGILEWGDGYYNGDIKTRKTVQSTETNADQLGLQRSEQLRELYESLLASESNPQAKRPSAALSPEDLTDTEWYFLVCMSFVFNIDQGLPGRALANNQTIWLCNAHYADSKVFSRSLLAKSASIQTVVCFPHLGGVIELGITELVLEEPNLVQHIKASFFQTPYPILSMIPEYVPANARTKKDFASAKTEESYMVEGTNGGASQVQSWQLMDDGLSNCVHNSMNSSDCISQTFVNPEKDVPLSNGEKVKDDCQHDAQECNQAKITSFGFRSDEIHYQSVLSSLLKSSHQLILGPCFQNSNKESSFVCWNKEISSIQIPQRGTPQKLLKKVLFEVAQMHGDCLIKSREDKGQRDGLWRPEADEIDTNHALLARRQREKMNKRFLLLGSLVPTTSKFDKVSILDDTIKYLKELERRVEKLESCKEVEALEARTRGKPRGDSVERTSDNYGNNKFCNKKKTLINKRKACDIDEMEPENNGVLWSDSQNDDDVTVSVTKKYVLIEMRCTWRESLLLEIMDAVSNLHLDSHTVQSSTVDGILSLTIRSKVRTHDYPKAMLGNTEFAPWNWDCRLCKFII